MKFWIRINGLQEGPMEIDQMKQYNITPSTFVWCAGMKDWAYARDVEDLKEVLAQCASENAPSAPASETNEVVADVADSQTEANSDNNTIDEVKDTIEVETEQIEEATEVEDIKPTIESTPAAEEEEVATQEVASAEPVVQPVVEPQHTAPVIESKSDDIPPCPSTNLIWAILATVFCCQVTGIIAIVFAAQVTTKYREGDYDTAKKYSNWSAWLVIASVILSILWASFAFPFMLISEMM